MSVTRAQIKLVTDITLANTAPFSGAAVASANIDEAWGTGAATRNFNRMSTYTYVMAPSATQILDLQTDLQQDLTALGLVEVRFLQIIAAATNDGAALVTVEPDATDGWVSWMQVGSVMNLAPSSNQVLVSPIDGQYLVTGTNKQLLFTNTDGVNPATITVVVAGVDA